MSAAVAWAPEFARLADLPQIEANADEAEPRLVVLRYRLAARLRGGVGSRGDFRFQLSPSGMWYSSRRRDAHLEWAAEKYGARCQ